MSSILIGLLLAGCSDKGADSGSADSAAGDDTAVVQSDPVPPVAAASAGLRVVSGKRVELDGSRSYDPDDPAAELIYSWEVTEIPAGGSFSLSFPDSAIAEFKSSATGVYRLLLTVTDKDGLSGSTEAVVEVVAPEDLVVSLTWATEGADVDLHVVGPDGAYWTDQDCYYGNPAPDWGVQGDTTDDPTLSQDDDNTGPETISVPSPVDGEYAVYVHYYGRLPDVSSDPGATVSVVSGEAILATPSNPSMTVGRVWFVGTLDWASQNFTPSDEVFYHEDLVAAAGE